MNLTEEQQNTVRDWAAAGAGLSEIQTRLAAELDIHISYMETRFLMLDLNAKIKDKEEPKKKPEEPAEKVYDLDEEAGAEPEVGGVSVEINKIAHPGFALTGTVVFSDGVKADWGITQDGRFSLDAEKPGYRPSNDDLKTFQLKLRELCSSQGY